MFRWDASPKKAEAEGTAALLPTAPNTATSRRSRSRYRRTADNSLFDNSSQSSRSQMLKRHRHTGYTDRRMERRQERESPYANVVTAVSRRQKRHHSQDSPEERRDRDSRRRARERGRRERQPQYEMDASLDEKAPVSTIDIKAPQTEEEKPAEPGLFSFPWNWNPTPAIPSTPAPPAPTLTMVRNSRPDPMSPKKGPQPKQQPTTGFSFLSKPTVTRGDLLLSKRTKSIWDKLDPTVNGDQPTAKTTGVPSVIFANPDDDCFSTLDESRCKQQRRGGLEKAQNERLRKLREHQEGPRKSAELNHHNKHRGHKQQQHHHRGGKSDFNFMRNNKRHYTDEDSDKKPIIPSPHIPVMVGNQEAPILCSDSLAGSVHRRYMKHPTAGRGTVPDYKRRNQLRKQTIHDLTALESVSTYDLEQRYHANEVHSILMNKASSGRDAIALPRLASPTPSHYIKAAYNRHQPYQQQAPLSPTRATAAVASATPKSPTSFASRIGNNFIFNMSGLSKPKSPTVSTSLEKMKSNLREKQSLLTKSVTDLKHRQQQQQQQQQQSALSPRSRQAYSTNYPGTAQNPFNADRLRQPVRDRNPDTVPLLQNQNYISDIFTDIASKFDPSRPRKQDKEHYLPRASDILHHSKKEREKAKHQQKRGNHKVIHLEDEDSRDPRFHAGMAARNHLSPARSRTLSPSRRDTKTGRRRNKKKSRHHDYEQVDMAMLDLDLPDISAELCGMADQMEMLMSPKSNHSSIYLPNMRSRRNTPVPGTPRTPGKETAKLSFRSSSALAKQMDQKNQKGKRTHSFVDLIDVTSIANSPAKLKNAPMEMVKGAAAMAVRNPRVIQDDTSTPTNQLFIKVPIDVSDLESSKFSHTTVKKVICLDEDSQGNIHTKRKLAAMPKHGKRHILSPIGRQKEKQGKEDTVSPGPTKMGNSISHSIVDLNDVVEEEEGEIVFAESPDANKGLFEGIWDIEIPNFGSMNETPKTPTSKKDIASISKTPETPTSKKDIASTSKTPKTPTSKKPIDLSKLGDDGNESLASSILMSTISQERDRRGLLGHLLKSRDAMLKAPKVPVDEEKPSSPGSEQIYRHQIRGRDPSAIPWAHPTLFSSGSKGQTRDAPMMKTSNQREPEGQGLPDQGHMRIENLYGDYADEDDDDDEDDNSGEAKEDHDIVQNASFPRPCRRTSARRLTSVPSHETRSVTFREGKTILGPKSKSEEQPVPAVINTDHYSRGAGSSSQRSASRSVRRHEHPWEDQVQAPLVSPSQSQCSSRRPFHSLSTPATSPRMDSSQGRPRRIDLLAKARTSRGLTPSITSKKSASSKRSKGNSMLGDFYDATLRFPDMIILDVDSDNVQERAPMPAQIDVKVATDQQQVWDDVSETLSGSINRSSVVEKGRSAGTTSSRELARAGGDHFFDYLCL